MYIIGRGKGKHPKPASRDGTKLSDNTKTESPRRSGATGFDLHDAGGPALSISELVNGALGAGLGYAIGDTGQFQLYIREFKQTA